MEETISTVKWLHQDIRARAICESHISEYLAIPKSPSLRISLTHLQAWAWSELTDPVGASDPSSAIWNLAPLSWVRILDSLNWPLELKT